MAEGQKPSRVLRSGAIRLSLWLHEGKNGKYHSCALQRRYKDEAGNWKSTPNFTEQDLLDVVAICSYAHQELRVHEVEFKGEVEKEVVGT
jgi:hypothetical protein